MEWSSTRFRHMAHHVDIIVSIIKIRPHGNCPLNARMLAMQSGKPAVCRRICRRMDPLPHLGHKFLAVAKLIVHWRVIKRQSFTGQSTADMTLGLQQNQAT